MKIFLLISYALKKKQNELSELTLKYINEFSSIDFHRQCGDDPEHNAKARKAKALLLLIRAKAKDYGQENIKKFVEEQWFREGSESSWSARCKF